MTAREENRLRRQKSDFLKEVPDIRLGGQREKIAGGHEFAWRVRNTRCQLPCAKAGRFAVRLFERIGHTPHWQSAPR